MLIAVLPGMAERHREATMSATVDDPVESARSAGLHYVSDDRPGISRRRAGKGFVYVAATGKRGKRITDYEELARIRALAIPPAWTDVWICPDALGHIQAVGRDARGRKQYRYHSRWTEVRDQTKYDKMIDFAKALPKIRRRVQDHLKLPGLPREKVLAAVVRLLRTTLIRVGNEEYARANDSYGLTTMQDDHVDIRGSRMRFHFRGKGGIKHAIDLEDKRLAKIVRSCQELPGEELFQYVDDDGTIHDVQSADVNEYLRQVTGQDFTAKDFRTWAGTVLAAMALREIESVSSQRQAKRNIVRAVESVAKRLGNTVAVCRKCYIHPAILDAYIDGSLAQTLRQRARQVNGSRLLSPDEAAVLRLLERRLQPSPLSRRRRVKSL